MEKSKRTFYRKVFAVEVLSKNPIPEEMDLDTLHYEITNGDWSGMVSVCDEEELTGEQMAKALMHQQSDPSFFGLTENGCDTEEL